MVKGSDEVAKRKGRKENIGHGAKADKRAEKLCCTLLTCNILKQSSPVALRSFNCKEEAVRPDVPPQGKCMWS